MEILGKRFYTLKVAEERREKSWKFQEKVMNQLTDLTPSEHLQRHLQILQLKGGGKGKTKLSEEHLPTGRCTRFGNPSQPLHDLPEHV